MSRYIPTSVRDKGLKQHLGDERYAEFVKRMNLKEPMTVIGNAIGVSRQRMYYYRDIYHEEQSLHKAM